jgi:hypothetical protein
MARPRNDELYNRVIALAKTGLLYSEIEKIVGVRQQRVAEIVRIYGGIKRKRGRRVGTKCGPYRTRKDTAA